MKSIFPVIHKIGFCDFVLTVPDKPFPPRNLRAVETNRDYIVITWEAPESDGGASITNYVLEKHDAKHPGYIYMAEVDADTFQYKATRLFEGYEYYFQVIAENQVGPSDPCETNKPIKAKLPFGECWWWWLFIVHLSYFWCISDTNCWVRIDFVILYFNNNNSILGLFY